jgi:hypothetical protein
MLEKDEDVVGRRRVQRLVVDGRLGLCWSSAASTMSARGLVLVRSLAVAFRRESGRWYSTENLVQYLCTCWDCFGSLDM